MDNEVSLLAETIGVLSEHEKSPSDVRWVGSSDGWYALSWDAFSVIADIVYDAGFGGQNIASDLVVVGDDWWMERHEYDGSEWWEFKALPQMDVAALPFATVMNGEVWATVKEMNRPGGKYKGGE